LANQSQNWPTEWRRQITETIVGLQKLDEKLRLIQTGDQPDNRSNGHNKNLVKTAT